MTENNMIYFTCDIEPRGQARPRFTTRGGYAMAYSPRQNREFEREIQKAYMAACPNQGFKGFARSIPVAASITINLPIRESWSKKKQAQAERGEILPTKKPDSDNVAKAVLDALNGLAYHDDAQIVSLSVVKKYSEKPGIEILLMEIKGE